jgi:hypothetical protein
LTLVRQRLQYVHGATHVVAWLAAVGLMLASATTPTWAYTGDVDGISDQHPWVGTLPSQIELTRYVVQWDVMRGAGYLEELANLQRWYRGALDLHLTPDLALDNYNCSGCGAPRETAEYASELEALGRAFPDIQVLEAWNEPNDSHYTSYIAPAAASQLMNAAHSFCEAHGCTAIAGDLLDSEANMVEYEEQYERGLQPRDPGDWGIHPYHAVKYLTASTVASFRAALPHPTSDRLWFTEVGAYYCEAGQVYGERSQEEQARFLTGELIPEFQPEHVFYYEIANSYGEPPACSSQQSDTALYATTRANGSARARAAAGVIFGAAGSPGAGAASPPALDTRPAVQAPSPPDFACEPALDTLWQRGECSYLGELFTG